MAAGPNYVYKIQDQIPAPISQVRVQPHPTAEHAADAWKSLNFLHSLGAADRQQDPTTLWHRHEGIALLHVRSGEGVHAEFIS